MSASGPLLFGRRWCGWACWTVMVLDLLPFSRPSGRLPGRWGSLCYLHLALSVSLVQLLVFGFREGAAGPTAVAWFIIGNLTCYAVGIALAHALLDNRAFCKYLCPVIVPLKITSRFSLLKIGGEATRGNDCGAWVKMCPMDVRIPEYLPSRQRVLSTECSLCRTCITVCAPEASKAHLRF